MKLDRGGIVTKDREKAIKFYETLGFVTKGDESEDYVELKNNGVRISLNTSKMVSSIYRYKSTAVGDKVELAFLYESTIEVDEIYKKMITAGYESFKEPWDAFWGQRYAIIKDTDGNSLSLFANL